MDSRREDFYKNLIIDEEDKERAESAPTGAAAVNDDARDRIVKSIPYRRNHAQRSVCGSR